MSNHNDSVAYDPLPLTSDDAHSDTLYNAPASSDPRLSTYHTPQMVPSELGADDTVIPPGAAQPRFLGAALYDGPGSRSFRDSIASSQHTSPASEYNSSVYALNEPSGAGRFDGSYRDDPRDSYYTGEQGGVPMNAMPSRGNRTMEEKRAAYAPPRAKSRRKLMICAVIACICLLIAAVIIPVYFFILKPSSSNKNNQNDSSSSNDSSKTGSASPSKPSASAVAVTGGDGTLITMEDGTTFTYKNPFGGYWYWDENDPFNNGAKAQSWTPALNETFQYGVDKIRGYVSSHPTLVFFHHSRVDLFSVNFGGWLNTEPVSNLELECHTDFSIVSFPSSCPFHFEIVFQNLY
jgi:glucan 1,3-beta-glucosidase